MACISDSFAINIAVPFKPKEISRDQITDQSKIVSTQPIMNKKYTNVPPYN